MIRLAIIEDDAFIRQMLTDFFSSQPGFACLLSAGSVEAFFEQLNEDTYLDIVLTDIGLPGMSGIEGISSIKKSLPKCNVIMLTVYDDSEKIFQALCAGATGYLLKQTPLQRIKEAVQTLYDGGAPMSPAIARKVVDYFNYRNQQDAHEHLTSREVEVVTAIQEGLSNKEVSIRLTIKLETVKFHIKNIYQKLQVNSRHAIIKGNYKKRL